ncbi:hypothetical protein NUACC21_05050 [Scytonema sp. NUACC21]
MPYEPDATALKEIVKAHLENDVVTKDEEKINQLIEKFRTLRKGGDVATDQLLNAIYIVTREFKPTQAEEQDLIEVLLKYLTSAEDR